MIYHVISTKMATFFLKSNRYIEWNVIQQEKEQNSDTYNNVDEP